VRKRHRLLLHASRHAGIDPSARHSFVLVRGNPRADFSKERNALAVRRGYGCAMSPDILKELCDRQAAIRDRWERLLRLEPVRSALALPDTLVHLIPESMGTIFRMLAKRRESPITLEAARAIPLPICGCSRNPYLAYFTAGEQAIVEEIVLIQSSHPTASHSPQEIATAIRATRRLAASEIDTFCSVCVHRAESTGCRYYAAAR
jgi:hypothetical protein